MITVIIYCSEYFYIYSAWSMYVENKLQIPIGRWCKHTMDIELEKIKSDRICVRFPEWVQMKTIELIQREQRTESCSEREPLNLMTRAKKHIHLCWMPGNNIPYPEPGCCRQHRTEWCRRFNLFSPRLIVKLFVKCPN